MQIGIVSDTHGNLANSARAAEILKQRKIKTVLHCGDIGSPSIPQEFTGFDIHYVFGNVDCDTSFLKLAISEAGGRCHDRFAELEIGEKKIAMLHGNDHHRLEETIACGRYDLVCYGHTHKPESHTVGPTLVLNPGALHRANPHTIAIVNLDDLSVVHLSLSKAELFAAR